MNLEKIEFFIEMASLSENAVPHRLCIWTFMGLNFSSAWSFETRCCGFQSSVARLARTARSHYLSYLLFWHKRSEVQV